MYSLIQHRRLDAPAANIEFNSIPANFTDLYLTVSSRTSNTGTCAVFISFNGSTNNFSSTSLEGNGSTTSAFTIARFIGGTNGSGTAANTFTSIECRIPNYRSPVTKSYSATNANENNAIEAFQTITAGLWADTAPITSLTVTPQLGNFVEGTTATLYGINRTEGIGKPKAIGGNITFANGHWVHTFTGSGTFYAQQDLQVDALIVAGGGGGGFDRGGGGGAGGYLSPSQISVPKGNYPVVVGAGGAAQATDTTGNSGSTSAFMTNTAIGGGGGGAGAVRPGLSGGSGGGAAMNFSGTGVIAGGAGTLGQGFAGSSSVYGAGGQDNPRRTGGGGGAGGVAPEDTNAPNGGPGRIWLNGQTYAGGGGGSHQGTDRSGPGPGTGGIGGGGNGATASALAIAGTTNTGGGGGGGNAFNSVAGGAAGGSGVVIIRYRAD